MNFFTQLNQKLDEGWKLTDSNCPFCKSSIIYNPKDKSLFCIKCDKPCKMDVEIIDEQPQSKSEQKKTTTTTAATKKSNDDSFDDYDYDDNEFKWNMSKTAPPSRTDEISKLLSQKLLKGYAMLQECCAICYAPIMKSKQGEYTCVGCNWVKTKKEFDALVEASENPQQTTTQQTSTQQKQPTQQPQQQQQQQQQYSKPEDIIKNVEQQSVPQKQNIQPIINSGESKNFYSSIQRILNKSADFYERQIDQYTQQGQTAIVDSIIKTSIRELIETQKLLEKQQ